MRIDIHPDFLGESLARQKQQLGRDPSGRSPTAREAPAEPSSDYERLMECIYDGVLVTDRYGLIVDFNERAVYFFFC